MKVLSLVNMKGGVAKTTLAVNLADVLNRREGKRVLLIDIDPQFNATQCIMNGNSYKEYLSNKGYTVLDVFNDTPLSVVSSVNGTTTIPPKKIEEIIPYNIRNGFDLLPGALELHRLEMGSGQGKEMRLRNYINHLRTNDLFDWVIIDTPPTPSAWMSAALIASDYYLTPVRPEPLSATGIDLLRVVVNGITSNYGLNLSCLGVVLTMAEENTIVFSDAVDFIDNNTYWKGKRISKSLPKRTAIARGQGNQSFILDLDDHDLNISMSRITKEVIERAEA
ncbi:chromosome partitioning protein [Enterobacter sp. BIGb0383]|uniref:ParA family protein n=1 Tax=unclassified Enterobacter TaxID=2608935 RepID=UPI000F49E492|nr:MULTISPECIES: ParA family protein [unclassified Enterobacter]ROP56169.1 chromosome partitioning protein [Enterobacter sp. BIGb0383]ROS05907.1 chromosome partitioning protein [Enterobacter sp. BIGb0359]